MPKTADPPQSTITDSGLKLNRLERKLNKRLNKLSRQQKRVDRTRAQIDKLRSTKHIVLPNGQTELTAS